MTRRAIFRESTTGALDDGAGGVVHGVPDPSGEPDGKVLETSSGALVYGTGGTGGDVAGDTHAASSKATPVDADEIPLVDSAASFALKKLTWANLKATAKTYFDTLYQPIGTGGAPSGSAGGDLGGTYPNPTVAALHETTGPTKLTLGSVPDGDYLVRSGSTIIGGSPTPGGPPTGAAGGDLAGTYPNPSLAADVTPGLTQLVYRYTVTGSDKASIDTGVDTPAAGSNDWTNGDLLEIFIYARTDEAVVASVVNVTLNNDATGHYDLNTVQNANTTLSGTNGVAASAWALTVAGASCAASVFSPIDLRMPNYMGTAGNKVCSILGGIPDTTAANTRSNLRSAEFRSTSAVSRLAIAPATAAKNLKVGSQVLIYKRLAS